MKLLVCDKMSADAVEELKSLKGLEVEYKVGMTPEELIKTIPGYEGMVVRSATKVTKDIIDAATSLKFIIRGGIGVDNIDTEAAKAKGIQVCITPTATTNSVAELAIGLMFALARHIGVGHDSIRRGQWLKKDLTGTELMGKTLGFIGGGRIAKRTAELARAIGFKKVIAFDPYVDAAALSAAGMEKKTLEEVLAEADWVSLNLPKTPETANMIGDAQLAKCKKGIKIVNAARGGIINEAAMVNALKSGQVGGYATDVFEKEPPDFAANELLKLDRNVVFTPHIGAATAEGQERVGAAIVETVKEFLK